jgi:hypothetical protein
VNDGVIEPDDNLAVISIAGTVKWQRLGDLIADTAVVIKGE